MKLSINTGEPSQIVLNETDEVKSIIQNIKVILSTYRGTVPLDREFGIDASVIDRPVNVAKTLLYADIKNTVEKYEPRATVVGVTYETPRNEAGRLIPIVEVEI